MVLDRSTPQRIRRIVVVVLRSCDDHRRRTTDQDGGGDQRGLPASKSIWATFGITYSPSLLANPTGSVSFTGGMMSIKSKPTPGVLCSATGTGSVVPHLDGDHVRGDH